MQVTQRFAQLLIKNVGRVIVGKEDAVELMMIALLCRGHVLIEDVPGVGKTTLASALAEQMADAAEGQLRQWAAEQRLFLTGRFSPGYGDWPISLQPLLAETLDTARQIGLYVTDTYLMTPRKSVTALLGVSDHPVRGQLAGCGHCVLRARCNYRKRGITCAEQ